ncbi:MAG: hypothetical protein M1840_006902 [Geoglossum simile]|nr:MAG: hypothetical protein M1840_006902 [Geoglossum simile]
MELRTSSLWSLSTVCLSNPGLAMVALTGNNDAMSVAPNDDEMSPDNVTGIVTKLENPDNRPDSQMLQGDIDMGDPNSSSDDDTESWAEQCLSEPDLTERMNKINEGWFCTHFPALLALNIQTAGLRRCVGGHAGNRVITHPTAFKGELGKLSIKP